MRPSFRTPVEWRLQTADRRSEVAEVDRLPEDGRRVQLRGVRGDRVGLQRSGGYHSLALVNGFTRNCLSTVQPSTTGITTSSTMTDARAAHARL
jgi:hypothetical protein